MGEIAPYPSTWKLFAPHHYLSSDIAHTCVAFAATWNDTPVAFSAWLPYLGAGRPGRREHRTVTLPDYQGVGIGHALSTTIASLWRALGYRPTSTTTHPAFISKRRRDPNWRLTRAPSVSAKAEGRIRHATTRLTAGFEYIGPPMNPTTARQLLDG